MNNFTIASSDSFCLLYKNSKKFEVKKIRIKNEFYETKLIVQKYEIILTFMNIFQIGRASRRERVSSPV